MKEHLKAYIDSSKTAHVRGLRILLEYFYATEIFEKIVRNRIKIISIFGSARTKPNSPEYRLSYRLGGLLYRAGFAVVTGASRGTMEAANQGVADEIARELVGRKKALSLEEARQTPFYRKLLRGYSVGLNISLPMEAASNPFVGVNATFHYFMVRKFFFGTLSSGFIACEGGWGTRDELYEILTLVQTGKAPLMPIVYLSPDPTHLKKDFEHALRKKYISEDDLSLIDLVTTPEGAVHRIRQFYHVVEEVHYDREQLVRIVLKKKISTEKKKKAEKIIGRGASSSLSLEWKEKELILRHYAPSSYGPLRRAVDLINLPS
jgi:uncharacterized protein (TIGR00730 family)